MEERKGEGKKEEKREDEAASRRIEEYVTKREDKKSKWIRGEW